MTCYITGTILMFTNTTFELLWFGDVYCGNSFISLATFVPGFVD